MSETSTAAAPRPRLPVAKIVIGLVAVAAVVVLARAGGAYIPSFTAWVNRLGAWGPAVFILGYAIATVAFLPGSLLTLAGGAIFGIGWGVLYVYYGKLAGDVAALAGGGAVEKGPGYYAVLALGLFATVLVTWVVTRAARNALRQAGSA